MHLILSLPLFVASFLTWNRVRGFLASGNQADFRPLFPHDPTYAFGRWLDAQNVTEINFIVYTLIAGLFLAALGFFYDVLLKSKGFGPSGNAWLLLVGMICTAWGWSVWAPLAFADSASATALVSAIGGGLLLLLAAQLSHLVGNKLDDFGSGAAERDAPKKSRGRAAGDVIGRRPSRSA